MGHHTDHFEETGSQVAFLFEKLLFLAIFALLDFFFLASQGSL
jgi:hypothetical protein